MASMRDIINSPLLLVLVAGGLLYIVGFSLVYLKKAYTRCIELGISKEDLMKVIKSSLVFSIVPSLSIVVGLFALIAVMGVVWSWWRLSVIGSLPYETMISSSVATAIGYANSAEMLASASGRDFGVVMILMSVGMLSGTFMLCLFAVYIPVLIFGDTIQMLVMVSGLIVAVGLGVLSRKPGLKWLSEFIMAFSMIVGMASSLLWVKLFG